MHSVDTESHCLAHCINFVNIELNIKAQSLNARNRGHLDKGGLQRSCCSGIVSQAYTAPTQTVTQDTNPATGSCQDLQICGYGLLKRKQPQTCQLTLEEKKEAALSQNE